MQLHSQQDYKVLFKEQFQLFKVEGIDKDRPNVAQKALDNMRKTAIENNNDSLLMLAYEYDAYYDFFLGDYEESIKDLYRSLEIAESNCNIYRSLDIKDNIADVFYEISNYTKSRETYEAILKTSDEYSLPKNDDYVLTMIGLGTVYQALGEYSKSDSILQRSLKIAYKLKDKRTITLALADLSEVKIKKELYDEAIAVVDSLELKYFDEAHSRSKQKAFLNRAKAYYYLDHYQKAEKDLKSTLALGVVEGMEFSRIEEYELFSKIKEKLKDYRRALEFKTKANQLKDSFRLAETNAKVLEIEEKYENEKKEKENFALKQQTAEKDLTIAHKNNLLLIGSLVFFLVIGILVFYQLKKSKKRNEMLQESIDKREKMAKELAKVRDNIAMDFHDDLGNKLARVSIFSNLLKEDIKTDVSSERNEMVDQIKSDVDSLYAGTRDFIFSLNASSNQLENLTTYLSDFGEEYLKQFKIHFLIHKNIQSEIMLPYSWSKQLIFIFKEAITNAIKHSQCQEIVLSFETKADLLIVKCQDDGVGMHTEIKKSNGLNNMVQRAEGIGGRLMVSSTKEKGTTIIFKGNFTN